MLSVSSAGVLVALPFLALTMVLGLRRLPAAVAATFAVFVAVGGQARGGVWYIERGWALVLAGCFVVLTMWRPRTRFFPRAFASVVATAGLVGLLLKVRPGSWTLVKRLVTEGMMRSISLLQTFMATEFETSIPTADLNTVYETVAQWGRFFPAFLGLSSLSALAVAWWAYVRLSAGSGPALGPLREFRFNDHLVWLLVIGLALIVFGAGGGWTTAGGNTVVFMGGLYTLRGAAVLLFLNGGALGLGFLVVALGMLVFAPVLILGLLVPVLILGALFVGVGDTWLDLRSKAQAIADGKS